MSTLTISPDHIPSGHMQVSTSMGRVAVWSGLTDAVAFPVRHSAALLNADGQVVAQYNGAETAWGAVAQLLIARRPYRSDVDRDLALIDQIRAEAQLLCAQVTKKFTSKPEAR